MELEKLVKQSILNLKPYSSARDEFKGIADVWLDANENPFSTDLNRYPDPLQQVLKTRIAEIKSCSTEQLFVGNGSDEPIDLLYRIFCKSGIDKVIICPPTYGMYEVSASIHEVDVEFIPQLPNFELAVDQIVKSNAKLLFLCSPNNPTGKTIPTNQIIYILQHFKGIVVLDEAYIDFSDALSLTILQSEYPQLVILQTFSKAYGMAGLRVGIAIANPQIIQWMNKVKSPYNMGSLQQKVALERLKSIDYVFQQVHILKQQRNWLAQQLAENPLVKHIYPSDANFILVRMHDAKAVYTYLAKHGVVVRDRSSQHLCEQCLRISVGTPEENKILIHHLTQFAHA